LVLREQDVRASGVEGEAVFDDRGAEAAADGVSLEDLGPLLQVGDEGEARDAAAEDADGGGGRHRIAG
jgi:hypothetical protein